MAGDSQILENNISLHCVISLANFRLFSNQLDIVSETYFSCDTVDRELWLAILSSLLCSETDRNICIGKHGYVIYFTG